jgi:hypothetical protein
MRHFQVKTLAGNEFAFRGRTQDKNMEPTLFFVCSPQAAHIVQEVDSAKKKEIVRDFPLKQTLIRCPYEDLESS